MGTRVQQCKCYYPVGDLRSISSNPASHRFSPRRHCRVCYNLTIHAFVLPAEHGPNHFRGESCVEQSKLHACSSSLLGEVVAGGAAVLNTCSHAQFGVRIKFQKIVAALSIFAVVSSPFAHTTSLLERPLSSNWQPRRTKGPGQLQLPRKSDGFRFFF